MRLITPVLGISAVALFCATLAVFSFLNPDFSHAEDYVSELGAQGQPFSFWWNLIGFFVVGLLFAAFGFQFGRVVQDQLTGILLMLFGIGFASTALPIDLQDGDSALSKAHTVAICLGVGTWALALARLTSLPNLSKATRSIANGAAILMVLPMFGYLLGFWTMPVTHRLVFAVVFGWYVVTSCRLLAGSDHLISRTPSETDPNQSAE